MAAESHERQEEHQIEEHLQIRSNGGPQSAPFFTMRSLPDLRLLDLASNEQCEQRRRPTGKEKGAPSEMRHDEKVGERSQEVAGRIALLKDAGEQTAPPRRNLLHD